MKLPREIAEKLGFEERDRLGFYEEDRVSLSRSSDSSKIVFQYFSVIGFAPKIQTKSTF